MIEAAMLWNEPNNKSHWDLELDPDWERFATMTRLAADAIAAEVPGLPRVLGGISPIDALFIANLTGKGVLDRLDVVAVHGFPLDWNLWMIDEWPAKLAEIATAGSLPVWVSEVGASSCGAEEVREFGLQRTAELLIGNESLDDADELPEPEELVTDAVGELEAAIEELNLVMDILGDSEAGAVAATARAER